MKPHEKLKEIRIQKGITTYQLSRLTGIPQSTISKMENGKRRIETDSLELLANALGVAISAFFNESRSNDSENNVGPIEEIDEEVRAIARDMKNLPQNKKQLLKELIKTMTEAGDEELRK